MTRNSCSPRHILDWHILSRQVMEVRHDLALELDRHRIAVTVARAASCYTDPSLADAIFLDVCSLLAVEPNTDSALQQSGVVERAFRIRSKAIGRRIVHGVISQEAAQGHKASQDSGPALD